MMTETTTSTPAATLFTRGGTPFTNKTALDGTRVGYWAQKRCSRCGGAGRHEMWRHTGLVCYDCNGAGHLGMEFHPLYTAEKLAKLNAAAEKRAAVKLAQQAVEHAAALAAIAARTAAFEAQHGALLARCEAGPVGEPVVADIVSRARANARLSDAQAALLVTACERFEQRAADAARSAHVGTIGERLTVAVTVARVASYEWAPYQSYGRYMETVWITTMVDDAGRQIVVKSPRFHEELGATFTLRATVVEHTEYQGAKQTVVQRATVVEPSSK